MLPEVGAVELLFIAAIALIVVGPKDLPVLMRKVGRFLAHMRSMASEFRASFDELARQSELEELRREVEAMRQAAHEPVATAASSFGLDGLHSEIESGLTETHQPHELTVAPAVATPKPKAKRARSPAKAPVAKAKAAKPTAAKTSTARPRTAKAKSAREPQA